MSPLLVGLHFVEEFITKTAEKAFQFSLSGDVISLRPLAAGGPGA